MPVTISGVEEGSLARRHGIQAGETLLSINGHPIADVLDYRFYLTEQKLLLELEGPCGPRTVHLRKKDPYDDIGLQFETYLMDKQHSCRNKCIFCSAPGSTTARSCGAAYETWKPLCPLWKA